MKNYWFTIALFFSWGLSPAQTNDSFSDGDFSTNPTWSGSTTQFIINGTQQLQLNNSLAGTSFLSTVFSASPIADFEWQVYVKQGFSPSGSNYGRVYLVSDESDLTKPLNGYYLQFGEAGSGDAVELFQQAGSVRTSVCRASNGAIAGAFALRIKITRDHDGLWKLFLDYTGGTSFILEASATNVAHTSSTFLGVVCTYTASNGAKFYFDDFYAGPAQADTTPPALQSIQVPSDREILLIFSEPLNVASQSISHYLVDQNLGPPQAATLQPDSKTITLTFDHPFKNGFQYQLTVAGIQDLVGNAMPSSQFPFLFFVAVPAQPKDIVITEIFPDFSPRIALPEAEYVEIYNRSTNPVDLSGWKLSDGNSTAVFPSRMILPQQYWIVTASSSAAQFNPFGNTISTPGFPALNNDGDILTLKSPEGITVDSVRYSIDYYRDADKSQGGWSLELIDPGNPCGEEDNWTASEDPEGGTPGKQNSVFASKSDLTGPRLLSIIPQAPDTVLLTFDEKLDASAASTGSFQLTPSIPISHASFTGRSLRNIQLILGEPLAGRQRYALRVQDVRDCNGNLILEGYSQIDFALTEPADSLDLLVNEILFNPRPNGVDFVEVHNRSPKYLNLKGWKLANFENNVLKNIQEITSNDFILSPYTPWVFTSDPRTLKNNYPQGQEKNFFQTGLPGLPDDEGSIAIVNKDGRVVDYFLYNKNFHSGLLKDDEGVSLERISFSSPGNDSQNWKSASAQSGFATPGYINSNARPETTVVQGTVTIDPEVFIPNSESHDFAKINYAFEQAGYIANIKVVDQEGHNIKTITNNENLGLEGFFRWDGDRDDGSKARIGYYAIWVEVFDVSGVVCTYRKRVTIATR
jgi:hypothetical protein